MLRKILLLFLSVNLLAALAACQQRITPPSTWPNESPTPPAETTDDSGGLYSPLPLVEMVESSDDSTADSAMQGGDGTPPPISAEPRTINTYGTDGSGAVSTIEVKPGYLEGDSEIDIWGSEIYSAEVASPPYIWGEDLDPDREYVQGLTAADGRVQFKIVAGYSTGTFRIYVSDGEVTLSTILVIK